MRQESLSHKKERGKKPLFKERERNLSSSAQHEKEKILTLKERAIKTMFSFYKNPYKNLRKKETTKKRFNRKIKENHRSKKG